MSAAGSSTGSTESATPAAAAQPAVVFTAGEAKQVRRLTAVLCVIATFFVIELGGAIVARSVVLQADAVHLLMDVFALAMSVLAMRLAVRRPTARFTFGLRRAEPVAAIFNAGLVLLATGEIVHEGIVALGGAAVPRADLMMVVASAALIVNGMSAWLLHDALKHGHAGHGHAHDADNPDDKEAAHAHDDHDHDHDDHDHDHDHDRHKAKEKRVKPKHSGHSLNLRGAWLHLAGDTLGSLAALVAAIVIRFGGPPAVDPLASFLVAAILVFGALRLVRDAVLVLLEAAPVHLPIDDVRQVILGVPEVAGIHDLHVWTLGAGHDAITVHVHAKSPSPDPALAARVSRALRDDFHVEYVTVQVDAEGPCDAPRSVTPDTPGRRS
jgi:cation diffusion facilitator family transporter